MKEDITSLQELQGTGRLAGKKAVVTGGSRGIGLAIVAVYLSEGAEVWYLSRSEAEAGEQLSAIAEKTGTQLHWVPCDMGDRVSIEASLDTILTDCGTIDILVNNAGITRDGLIMRMKDDAWDDVLSVNLTGPFIACRKVSRAMAKARAGAIINISSVVGLVGNGGQTNYAASKAGIIGFSKSLAKELASRSVRVNVIAPGFIETQMTEVLKDEAKEALKSQIPLGRLGNTLDIARAALFLATEDASYITGQVLAVDGGMVM